MVSSLHTACAKYSTAAISIVSRLVFLSWRFRNWIGSLSDTLLFSFAAAEKITNNDYKGFWVVQFHATWSPLCTQLAPLFASIAQEYDHVRIKFGKVDAGLWPEVAEKHDINVAGTSSQLPSYVVFKIGKESNRYPALDADRKTVTEDIAKANRNLVVANLSLKEVWEQAEAWEEEARKKFKKEQAKKKAT
eukprot:CAMPEP_0184753524 /NCGR_PEP_ID=MMETSP0315-20130426/44148_1 /TAXON_ID=101924 /ORGANISM="Rhodosorus marinus, Strain UTEX LB 2760" /LENGTH=190 /DNA_ID=CAMNT_0027232905 /DNA_START=528 /DNA_END=1100 /DNA_ORIENTATION=-